MYLGMNSYAHHGKGRFLQKNNKFLAKLEVGPKLDVEFSQISFLVAFYILAKGQE